MSFFMGFATGLAKSVDTQLKESIERTRDNIDMVSKWRLKKAEEREKERRSKDKEVEKMIKDAAYVISGDQNDVTAQNIAASLYQERGLTGFTEDIDFLKQQKSAGVGVRPLDFIQRASVDVPANKFGLSEIVRSLSDAESTYAPSDMIFPKGTIKGSGLIGAIAPDFDVTAAGGQRATDQMKQIGLTTTPVAPSLSFAKYTFDREGLTYHTKDTNEKLSWLRDIIVNPASTPEQVKKAQDRETALLNLSMEQGDAANALAAAEQMLNRAKPTDENYKSLVTQVTDLKDRIALQEAELEGEAEVLKVQANIAARDGTDEGLAKALELNRKARDVEAGGIVTTETKLSDIEEDMKRKQAQFGDAYMNSTGEFVNRGYAEDNKMRMEYRTEIANFKGTTTNDINSMVTTIYSNAKKRLASMNPVMLAIVNKAETAGSDTSKQIDVMMTELLAARQRGETDENSIEAFKSAIRDVASKTKAMKAELGEETISVDRALEILLSESVSDPTGVVGATGAGTDETDAAFSLDPTVPGPELDFDMPTDEVMEAELAAKLSAEEVAALENKYPNDTSGATSIVSDLASQGKTFDEIVAGVSDIHDESFAAEVQKVAENVEKVVSKAVADSAVTDITATESSVILGGANKSKVVTNVANELGISSDAASSLIDKEVERVNAPIRMAKDQATAENVMKVLNKEGLIALGGGVAPLRRKKAVLAVANAFNMNPADAEGVLDSALNIQRQQRRADAPETLEEKMERLNPDVILSEDPIERLFKGRPSFGADDVPYRKVGDEFFRINDDGTLDEKPASPAIARELQKRMSSQAARSDEGSDSLLFDRDQMKRGLMYPLEMFGARVDDDAPGVPVSLFGSKSEEGEQDNRKARDLVVPSERTSPENRMRGASNAALIAAYISEDMSDLERKEIRRRLETDKSFVDQLAAVLDRVNKKKKGQDSKLTEDQLKALRTRASKQQVPMARGGLMGR